MPWFGVTLDDAATTFRHEPATGAGIINDAVGPYPVVVHVEPEDRSIHNYLRQVGIAS